MKQRISNISIRSIALLCLVMACGASRAAQGKPNIVFILSDDHSYHLDGSGRAPEASTKVFEEKQMKTFRDRFDYVDATGQENVPKRMAEFYETEEELKVALQRKMILDFDYLPLPIAPELPAKDKRRLPRTR